MTSEWVDITEELAFDCAQLKLGQLVHEPGFSLHEAMTAIEIMHPQVPVKIPVISFEILRRLLIFHKTFVEQYGYYL